MKRKILTIPALPFFKKSLEIASKSEVTFHLKDDVYTFTVIFPKEREELVNKITKLGGSLFTNVKFSLYREDMLN